MSTWRKPARRVIRDSLPHRGTPSSRAAHPRGYGSDDGARTRTPGRRSHPTARRGRPGCRPLPCARGTASAGLSIWQSLPALTKKRGKPVSPHTSPAPSLASRAFSRLASRWARAQESVSSARAVRRASSMSGGSVTAACFMAAYIAWRSRSRLIMASGPGEPSRGTLSPLALGARATRATASLASAAWALAGALARHCRTSRMTLGALCFQLTGGPQPRPRRSPDVHRPRIRTRSTGIS